MRPARGDTKPCDEPACAGIMQYGRPEKGYGGADASEDDALRWICSQQTRHATVGTVDPGRLGESALRGVSTR